MIAPKFTDEMIKKLLDIDDNLTLIMHMQIIDPMEAIKMIKRALTDIQKMKIEEQKKAVRSGYDMGATRSLITVQTGNKAYTIICIEN